MALGQVGELRLALVVGREREQPVPAPPVEGERLARLGARHRHLLDAADHLPRRRLGAAQHLVEPVVGRLPARLGAGHRGPRQQHRDHQRDRAARPLNRMTHPPGRGASLPSVVPCPVPGTPAGAAHPWRMLCASCPYGGTIAQHSPWEASVEPLDDGGVGHAAALAHREQAVAAAGALELVEQRGQQPVPEAPSGWPSAMAPPLTLTLLMSALSSFSQASTTEAKPR